MLTGAEDCTHGLYLLYTIKPKSDCIYHAPIDLERKGIPFSVPNQSENGEYNLILVWFKKIQNLCSQSAMFITGEFNLKNN